MTTRATPTVAASGPVVICKPGTTDTQLFERLVANEWGNCYGSATDDGHRMARSCTTARFDARGHRWTTQSDYPEFTSSGAWSFHARTASAGLLCFASGSVVDFEISDDSLRIGNMHLKRGPAQTIEGSHTDLPTIHSTSLLRDLTAHAWAKTDPGNLDFRPSGFTMRADGTWTAQFRHGECTAHGTFSLIVGRVIELQPISAPNTCDARGRRTAILAASNEHPELVDGVLRFHGATYRDATTASDEQSISFTSYGPETGLQITATWRGELHAGVETRWKLRLHSKSTRPHKVGNLRIEVGPQNTQLVPVVDRKLEIEMPGVVFPPAGKGERPPDPEIEVAFTPPAGKIAIRIIVESLDDRQPYRSSEVISLLVR